MICRHEVRRGMAMSCRVQARPGRTRATQVIPQRVTLRDLSAHGCQLESPRLRVHRSNRLVVTLDEHGPIQAEVRWMRTGTAMGLRFTKPLNEAMVNDLAWRDTYAGHDAVPREAILVHDRSLRRVS